MNNESFNKYIEQTIKENWERIALSDFDGVSYHYKDTAVVANRQFASIKNPLSLRDII